jgi:hypothetical protein
MLLTVYVTPSIATDATDETELNVYVGPYSVEEPNDDCGTDCDKMDEIMYKSGQDWLKMSQDVFTSYVKEPDPAVLDNCLGSIGGISAGFNLGIPSLSGLLDKACKFAKNTAMNEIRKAAGTVSQKYSLGAYGFNASGGVGYSSSGTNVPQFYVNDTSTQTVNSIWKAIQ